MDQHRTKILNVLDQAHRFVGQELLGHNLTPAAERSRQQVYNSLIELLEVLQPQQPTTDDVYDDVANPVPANQLPVMMVNQDETYDDIASSGNF